MWQQVGSVELGYTVNATRTKQASVLYTMNRCFRAQHKPGTHRELTGVLVSMVITLT